MTEEQTAYEGSTSTPALSIHFTLIAETEISVAQQSHSVALQVDD